MNLAKVREVVVRHSTKASDIARQLALAGFALIWLFKTGDGTGVRVPKELLCPGILLILTLLLDFLQYFLSSVAWWGVKLAKQAAHTKEDAEFEVSDWVDILTNNVFYFGKLVPLVGAYVLIIRYVVDLMAK